VGNPDETVPAGSGAPRAPAGLPAQSRKTEPTPWEPLAVRPPTAASAPSPKRGPAPLTTILDFVERATGRATSMREHLTIFTVYSFMLLLFVLPVLATAAFIASKIAQGPAWPIVTSIAVGAASTGAVVFMKRLSGGGSKDPQSGGTEAAAADPSPDDPDASDPAGQP
jgi:hypothetical protein